MIIDYLENGDLAICDGYKFRRDKKTGYFLSNKKIDGKRTRLHVYIWERHNGKVKKGNHIHHVDGNKNNNDITNLISLSQRAHAEHHASEYSKENKDKILENLRCNAMPAAKEWHRSPEGSEWHKKHYELTKEKLYVEREFKCENCGKTFFSTQVKAKFCSNNCKSKARRKSGVDNIVKICADCGGEYVANKYQKTKYCPACKGNKHPRNRKRRCL